jgi:acyl-CoA dehydrogenase
MNGPAQAALEGTPRAWPTMPNVELGPLGAESELTELKREPQWSVHAFAEGGMRPVGRVLDRMTPDEVIAVGSPYWHYVEELKNLDFTPASFGPLNPEERARVIPIVLDEMGWGDAVLSIVAGANAQPQLLMIGFQRLDLMEHFPANMRGCWAITEPDHGSDQIDPSGQVFHPQGNGGRPNCVATFKGDKIIVNGQKSAMVSNAPTAELCLLNCSADTGNSPDTGRGVCVLVPMDAPGVTRGKPLDKMGQRALPHGEIFFDNVELSKDPLIAEPEDYQRAVHIVHAGANVEMAAVFTGVAGSVVAVGNGRQDHHPDCLLGGQRCDPDLWWQWRHARVPDQEGLPRRSFGADRGRLQQHPLH